MTLSNPQCPTSPCNTPRLSRLPMTSPTRVYGGIHYRTDQDAGVGLGKAVGRAVYRNLPAWFYSFLRHPRKLWTHLFTPWGVAPRPMAMATIRAASGIHRLFELLRSCSTCSGEARSRNSPSRSITFSKNILTSLPNRVCFRVGRSICPKTAAIFSVAAQSSESIKGRSRNFSFFDGLNFRGKTESHSSFARVGDQPHIFTRKLRGRSQSLH
jgi:hypothetical protein